MNRFCHVVFLMLTLCLVVGCASQGDALQEQQKGPVERLAEDAAKVDPEAGIRMRYNPVECNCTPWEAWVGERWVRTTLSWEEEEMAEELLAASDKTSSYRMKGELQGTPLLCTPSTLCLTMKVISWEQFEK